LPSPLDSEGVTGTNPDTGAEVTLSHLKKSPSLH
jgi:hypothetical protein